MRDEYTHFHDMNQDRFVAEIGNRRAFIRDKSGGSHDVGDVVVSVPGGAVTIEFCTSPSHRNAPVPVWKREKLIERNDPSMIIGTNDDLDGSGPLLFNWWDVLERYTSVPLPGSDGRGPFHTYGNHLFLPSFEMCLGSRPTPG